MIAHDGFTLYDLVSYNGKHNDANGEGNRYLSPQRLHWHLGLTIPRTLVAAPVQASNTRSYVCLCALSALHSGKLATF